MSIAHAYNKEYESLKNKHKNTTDKSEIYIRLGDNDRHDHKIDI